MDIKELKAEFEKLKYIEEKLEYLNFDEHLDCYVEKSNGMPVRLAAWVNGAFYGFKQAATAQAAPEGFVLVPKDKISHFYQDNDEPENFCNSSNDWDCLGERMDIQKEKIAHEKHLLSQGMDFKYLPNIQYSELENVYELIEWDEEYSEALNEINSSWCTWQAAKAQAVPEGFVLLPIKDAKFFSHDGDNYEVHDTLVEAKYEAECAMEHYRERLADQLSDPRSDGNFQNVGYGVVLAKSGYSIDHVVTQADIDKGDYSYEVGTEILSLFLVEAQEPTND